MHASKNRPRWEELPVPVRAGIEHLVGGPVVRADSCPGGFSPGFASRVTLASGGRAFVKAMDAEARPWDAALHRTEARTAAALPSAVPAPKLIGSIDDGHWTILAYEEIAGAEPHQPWRQAELDRVVAALLLLAQVASPSPVALPRDHPRLGGWAELARDRTRLARLAEHAGPAHATWVLANASRLAELEHEGLSAARGDALVHFDLYPHNILLTGDRVVFVDWPHARLGTPVIDLVTLLSSATADRLDPEPILRAHAALAAIPPGTIDSILAAHAGFLLHGGVSAAPPGLEAIAAEKLHIGLAALDWLHRRLAERS